MTAAVFNRYSLSTLFTSALTSKFIGGKFPKHKLGLYQGEGHREAGATRAHYVTVTGVDGEWMTVSSWGQVYDIRREEFDRYRYRHSCGLYSNIVKVQRRSG